jgi:tRNA dimethylallyltransferase
MTQPCSIFLAGPTGVGKSAVAIHLARRLGGEIISVDSMQVYRGLDIGTAKPSTAEMSGIPHHLIDVVDLIEPFDAAQFVRLATAACEEIRRRGRIPLFCGGTGFYFKAFLEGLGEAPSADPGLRALLNRTPLPELVEELAKRDPEMVRQIDSQNRRRVVRALEVIRLTGKPLSAQRARWRRSEDSGPSHAGHQREPVLSFGLNRGVEDLRQRIDTRVETMFQRGLVAETERLLTRGLERNLTAMQAIGYRQAVEHLRGARPLPETKALVKVRTRQFAKRQMTWFRRQADLEWLMLNPDDSAEATAEKIAAACKSLFQNPFHEPAR